MTRTLTLALAAAVVVSGCSTTPPDAPPAAPTPVAADTASPAPSPATGAEPGVTASDQPLLAGAVTVSAATDAPAFVVLHRDLDGAPGDVVGHAAVPAGSREPVTIELDADVAAGEVLWAMVHTDAGTVGTYEFPGPDVPLRGTDGAVVMTPFEITDED